MQPGENGERGQKKSMAQFQLKWVHSWLNAQPQCATSDLRQRLLWRHPRNMHQKQTTDHLCLPTCRPHSSIPKAEGPVMVSFVLGSHTRRV